MSEFKVTIEGWKQGDPIPERFAFGKPCSENRVQLSDNLSPAIRWSGAPEGTRSFAIICHDPDVPSAADDVNQEGKIVPADLPRIDFYHWVLVDLPANTTGLAEGAVSSGVTPKGKPYGPSRTGVAGINNYTDWFAGDPDMGGDYGNYDGPCPPWNDSIIHHYHFTVYALDVDSLNLQGKFGGPEALAAMNEHILAKNTYTGTYTLNPDLGS